MSSSQDTNISRKRKRYLEKYERQTEAEWTQPKPYTSTEIIPLPSTSNGENNVYSSSTSGDGFNLPNIYPTNNDLLEGDGELDSTNPFPAIFSDSDSDHEDTDRGSDDEDITACWEEAWAFMGKLSPIEGLRTWAIVKNVPRTTLNLLLAVLRNLYHLDVPKDARTFLKTPTEVGLEVQTISGGEFWYQGIETVLRNYFRNTIPEHDTLKIQMSIDGLPLFKSSTKQLWPILIWVESLPEAPVMLVGLFCGQTKPGLVEEFLGPLVEDFNRLQETGLRCGDKVVRLLPSAFVADSPARAFAKGMQSTIVMKIKNIFLFNVLFLSRYSLL
ncbi:uncharacterized protein LOC133391066 [Anopheles gambiae]|uniref:uncharacterized protein LOC133391066 n=1 Tax=Anopheles gambiae TaxID=7165 RepID=UPI002AC9A6CA|nr:uncharacterized protein LOC133391066 [Anopheles gambiae]